jgi:uncharacterized repeat protein (TIGR01451 family)
MKTTTLKQSIRNLILIALGMMIANNVSSNNNSYLPTVDEVDIKVTKEASIYNPELGDHVTFTMSAENLVDDEDATNLIIEEILPQGVSYVNHSTTGGTYDLATGEWRIDMLERSTKIFLTIEVEVTTVDEFCNTIRLKSLDERDINVKNNKVEICLTPEKPDVDIEVSKVASDYSPMTGTIVIFTMEAVNLSSSVDATNVILEELLATGLEYVDHTASLGSYNHTTGEWIISTLEAGETAQLEIEALVTTEDEVCNVIEFISADQEDSVLKNNKEEICLTPETPEFDIKVSKVSSDYSPAPGDVVIFTMEAENLSATVDAKNVLLQELLEDGLEYVDHEASLGSYNHITGEWKINKLKAGETAQLTIEAQVVTDERICNTIEFISADEEDTNPDNNKVTICLDPESKDLDLAVYKDVYNAVPKIGEISKFTVRVTNLHNSLSATDIEIEDILDGNLDLVDVSESTGSYDENTGIWSIAELGPGATATMIMNVRVNGSADNIAKLIDLNENDVNPNNDEAMASVSVSGSSGGNDGGLESDGSLAELIAQRNFSKGKTDAKKTYNSPAELVFFNEAMAKAGQITPESNLKSITDLVEFVPENGPFGTQAYITTPGDLLGVSNAREVFSADYFDADNKRMAAILGLTTNGGEVYNHTKVICDRLTGATLEMVKTVQVDNHSFIMNKLVQANGDIDYAVSFIAYVDGNNYIIDNRWHQEEYQVPSDVEIFNFQIWSATPQSTVELMESVFGMLKEKRELTYTTADQPEVPTVIVEKGDYRSGKIVLEVLNPYRVEQVKVKGSLTRFENATRESFSYELQVNIGDDGRSLVEVPTGFVFDADFSVGPTEGGKRDGLYFADGPWSKEFDRSGARIFEMVRDMHDGSSFADSYLLERNVQMNGEVKTYASLFRLLKPGSISVDLNDYNQLVFEGSGVGEVELTIAKSSIENWNDQYRIRFSLSANEKTYRVDFNQLKSSALSQGFTAEDIESVTISFNGDGVNFQPFAIAVKNMRFSKSEGVEPIIGQSLALDLNVYPNPMQKHGFIEFNLPETGETQIMIYDITGREVLDVCNTELFAGNHRMPINLDHAENGIYLVKMIYNHQVETKRINLVR